MPAAWAGAAAAIVGAGSTAYGASQSSSAAKKAAKAAQMRPFSYDTPLGTVNVNKGGLTASGGVGSGWAENFSNLVGKYLGDAGNVPLGTIGNAPFDLQSALGGLVNPGQTSNSSASSFLGANFFGNALQALGAAGQFDINGFAKQQLDRLNSLAGPGEQTAANSLATRLFGQGRLGAEDSRAGQLFRDLNLSQSQALDSRMLQALGLATSESGRLSNLATGYANQFTGLAGLDQSLRAGQQSQLQSLFGTLSGDQLTRANFWNSLRSGLLGDATTAQAGIGNSFAGLQNAINSALAGSGVSTNAAGISAQIAQKGANATADLYGSLGSSLIDAGMKYYNNSRQPMATPSGVATTGPSSFDNWNKY